MQARRLTIIYSIIISTFLLGVFLLKHPLMAFAACSGSGPFIFVPVVGCGPYPNCAQGAGQGGGQTACSGSACQHLSSNIQSCSFGAVDPDTHKRPCSIVNNFNYSSSGCSSTGGGPVNTPTPTCNNTCTAGDKKCSGGGSQSCGLGSDGCYHWGAVTPCSGGCYQGSCCANTCSPGTSKCSGGNVQICRGNGSQCNSWETINCQYGCENGACKNCAAAGGACGGGAGQCCSGSCCGGSCCSGTCVSGVCSGGTTPCSNPNEEIPHRGCVGGTCTQIPGCGVSDCTACSAVEPPPPRPSPIYMLACGTSCSCVYTRISSIGSLAWDGGCGTEGETCTPSLNRRDSDSPYNGLWGGGQGGFSVSVSASPKTGPPGFAPSITISLHDEISRRISRSDTPTYNYLLNWDGSHNDGGTFTNCTGQDSINCTKTLTAPTNLYTAEGTAYPISITVGFQALQPGGGTSCMRLGERCGIFGEICCYGLGCQAGRCSPVGSSATTITASYTTYVGVEPACMSGAGTEGPTSTPGGGGGWIKLVNTSFTSLGSLNNPLPAAPEKYDNSTSDPGRRYFIDDNGLSDPGEVIAETINVGSYITNAGDTVSNDVSSKNWKKAGMSFSPSTKVSSFIEYLKARKNYQKIEESQLPLISQITSDNAIYHILGDRTISDNGISARDNVVLVFDGDLTITTPRFNVLNAGGGRSIAILVKGNLTINSSVTELNGLFIVQGTINAPNSQLGGLKINGNLITQTSLLNGRTQSDNDRPSVLMVFDPNYYLDLLPYLSINTYDWRQLR